MFFSQFCIFIVVQRKRKKHNFAAVFFFRRHPLFFYFSTVFKPMLTVKTREDYHFFKEYFSYFSVFKVFLCNDDFAVVECNSLRTNVHLVKKILIYRRKQKETN